MTLDQQIQLVGAVGAWIAGLGSLSAAIIALWLAKRSEKVLLKTYVGLRMSFGGQVSQESLVFSVTNLGERSVNVVSVGWKFGNKKNKKLAIQPPTQSSPDQFPKKIEYGETGFFMVNFVEAPTWLPKFASELASEKDIESLRAQVNTSVGYVQSVKPEKSLLDRLRQARITPSNK